MKKKRLFYLRSLMMIALALVVALDVLFVLLRDRTFSPLENRNLQTWPALTPRSVTSGRFESRFDDYVSDQFPFRDGWIALKSAIDRLGGRTESNGVFLGRDGWLIQDFTPPTPERYAATMAALKGFIARHEGLPVYVMIAPTAVTVYADKLPALAEAGDESGYLDALARDLSGTATFVDLRPTFAERAGSTQLYYRTDHHWTTDGAYLAYLRLSEVAGLSGSAVAYERRLASTRFTGTLAAASGFRMTEREDLAVYLPEGEPVQLVVHYVGENERSASLYRAQLLDTRDQYAVFLGGNHPLLRIETTADNGRVLLVLKDSYANCFIPFLTPDFEKLVIVDPRYYTGDIDVLLEAESVTDVLILYNADTLASDTALGEGIGD